MSKLEVLAKVDTERKLIGTLYMQVEYCMVIDG